MKVKGKEKVYHANLLKKYFDRDETTVEGAVAVGASPTSANNVADSSAQVHEAEGEIVDFLEPGGYVAKAGVYRRCGHWNNLRDTELPLFYISLKFSVILEI